MEQIIYLEVDDDITIVRDRLRRAQSKSMLLVVPPGCKALERPLDVRLLRRQAAALKLSIALVSGSATLRDMAVEEGITVFARLSMGRRVARSGGTWALEDEPGKEGLFARLRRQRPRWWWYVTGPIVVVVVLGVLAWLTIMVWPSATVSVSPAQEAIGVSTWIEASVTTRVVDWERMTMPARIVQIEVVDRGEVETTGITNVAAEKATGTVLFVNSTQRQMTIPVDTIVSTSAGTPVRFRTVAMGVVEARGRVRVAIEALEGGPGGNVRANLINRVEGGLAASLNVTNEVPTRGGTTVQAHRVTHGDKQRVSDLMITRLVQKGYAEISAELEGEFLPIETMWINDYSIRTNYDHHIDDQSDTLALEMRAVVGGMVISQETADEIARRALARQVRSGFTLLPATVHVVRGDVIEVDDQTGNVGFAMEGVGLMKANIDIGLVQRAIRGRPIDEALVYLHQVLPVDVKPSLRVDPDWMARVPWMTFRISVVETAAVEEMAHALPGS